MADKAAAAHRCAECKSCGWPAYPDSKILCSFVCGCDDYPVDTASQQDTKE